MPISRQYIMGYADGRLGGMSADGLSYPNPLNDYQRGYNNGLERGRQDRAAVVRMSGRGDCEVCGDIDQPEYRHSTAEHDSRQEPKLTKATLLSYIDDIGTLLDAGSETAAYEVLGELRAYVATREESA